MNTKPILFSTPMVQAILNGTKLQTRRVVKGKALEWITTGMLPPDVLTRPDTFICPYGEVGDVLWVRESFYQYGFWRKNGLTKTGKQKWKFIADNAYTSIAYNDNPPSSIFKNSQRVLGWYKRSSLFMPKEACRLFLKIKDIRVERLQDISEQDAMAEGCPFPNIAKETFPTVWFEELWCKINGEQSWNENLWVWVIEFERIEKPENF